MDKFWEAFAGKLAERWLTEAVAPSLLFWFAIVQSVRILQPHVYSQYLTKFEGERYPLLYVAAALLLVLLTAALSDSVLPLIIRLQEGYYWPLRGWPLRGLHQRRKRFLDGKANAYMEVCNGNVDALPEQARARYNSFDRASRIYPADILDVMPTILGNVLRAAERQPLYRYGLDAILCWPRLWLLLPDVSRNEVSESRGQLDAAARAWLWTLIFGVATIAIGAPRWFALVIIVVLYAIYFYGVRVAQVYGSLLVSVFDLYRSSLYQSAGVVPPQTFAQEIPFGTALTRLFDRGVPGQLPHAHTEASAQVQETAPSTNGAVQETVWEIGPLRWRISRR